MTKSPLLDTHVWVWWMLGDARLPFRERKVLDDLLIGQRPRLNEISLWEAAMLVQLGRLRLDDGLEDSLRIAASPATVEVIPISPAGRGRAWRREIRRSAVCRRRRSRYAA